MTWIRLMLMLYFFMVAIYTGKNVRAERGIVRSYLAVPDGSESPSE